MKKTSILFVDDERDFSQMTEEYLEAKGFDVMLVHNGFDGLKIFEKGDFDLCLLDIKMPLKNGYTLAKEILAINSLMPIIFLTGECSKESKIKGLSLGVDDYVTKPFSMEILALRIKNVLKRVGRNLSKPSQALELYIGNYRFEPATHQLFFEGKTFRLSGIENKLLKLLCEQEVVEREMALKLIWKDSYQLKGRSLNVYISKIRHLLKGDSRVEIINIHGEGYKLVVREGY